MKKGNATWLKGLITIALISFGILMPGLSMAGSLEPTAAPASTMKTLDEVEPRTPIPGSSTAASVYTISESGSYYLAGDRVCSGAGILVNASNVTIDLMGYTLLGPGSGTDIGIYMNGYNNVEIRNGTVRGFGYGIYSTSGEGQRVINIRAIENLIYAIALNATNNLVKGCTVRDNGSNAETSVYGIYCGIGSIVMDNMVNENGTSADGVVIGIHCGEGGSVMNNTVHSNGYGASATVYGIDTANTCMITGNTSSGNGGLVSSSVYGINCGNGSIVTNNISSTNGISGEGTGYGINVGFDCLVDQNTAYANDINLSSCVTCTFGTNHAP